MDDISKSDLIIRDVVNEISNIANEFNDTSIEVRKSEIPKIVVKERLNKYFCAVDGDGNVAYYAKLPSTAKKDKIGGVPWLATFQEGWDWLCEQGLTGQQWNVLGALLARLDFDNYIRVSQTALAKKLHTKKSKISESIKKLIEMDLIAEGPRAGLNKTYILNPNFGIKGRQQQQKIVDYAEAKKSGKYSRRNRKLGADAPESEE